MAEHLLQHGATVHAKDAQGETPFRVAVDNGHLQLAASLLAVGAAIDAQDNCGFTAVHECAHMGQLDALAFLLARGADVNAVNAVGQAPLDVAATCVRKNRRGDVTRLLLERGARPSPFLASITTSTISMPGSTPVRSQRNFACFVSNLEQTQEDTDDEDDG
jgi:26S proteasome non-ATPase regulatory subunit 10